MISGHYVFKLRVPGGEKQMQTVDIYVRKSYPSNLYS